MVNSNRNVDRASIFLLLWLDYIQVSVQPPVALHLLSIIKSDRARESAAYSSCSHKDISNIIFGSDARPNCLARVYHNYSPHRV